MEDCCRWGSCAHARARDAWRQALAGLDWTLMRRMLKLGVRAPVKIVLHMQETVRSAVFSTACGTQRFSARIETSGVRAGGLIEITWLALLD